MTLNGVMAVTLRYFTEFGKPEFQHIAASAQKIESSRSLSHLLMSFLLRKLANRQTDRQTNAGHHNVITAL